MKNLDEFITGYYAVKETLNSLGQESAEFARGQAAAYLWGRMDAGERFESTIGDAFPYAYGIMASRGKADGSMTVAIREAWSSFRTHGEIRDYNGNALDSLPTDLRS